MIWLSRRHDDLAIYGARRRSSLQLSSCGVFFCSVRKERTVSMATGERILLTFFLSPGHQRSSRKTWAWRLAIQEILRSQDRSLLAIKDTSPLGILPDDLLTWSERLLCNYQGLSKWRFSRLITFSKATRNSVHCHCELVSYEWQCSQSDLRAGSHDGALRISIGPRRGC